MNTDILREQLEVTAICLAVRGYEAENRGCDPADAERYAAEHWHLYIEDGFAWILDEGRRIQRERAARRSKKRGR